ncbi:MAG: DUF1080 domain-containing protein [Planctomycetota bacterium]|nr:DUF1080 domain-containing protein [Planctomycetota bacterium]
MMNPHSFWRFISFALPLWLAMAATSQHSPEELSRGQSDRDAKVAQARTIASKPGGWQPLFNGKDLSNWVAVNVGPSTFTVSADEHGTPIIRCSGHPTGILRTEMPLRNFVFEMEFSHREAKTNAGLFIWSDAICARGVPFSRSVEVQVMDGIESRLDNGQLRYTSQGDVFAIHGAKMTPDRAHPEGWSRCLPSEDRMKPSPQWNHYRVVAIDGTLRLEVNGKEVAGGFDITPREGYLCLESEGGEVWFRNLRVKILPSTKDLLPAPSLRADPELSSFRPIFDGTLRGWTVPAESEGHWTIEDSVLRSDGQGGDLWTTQSFGDFEMIADWRWSGPSQGTVDRPLIGSNGATLKDSDGKERTAPIEEYDSGIFLRGNSKSQVNLWNWNVGSGEVWGYRTDGSLPEAVRAACTPSERADAPIGQWNRMRITMVGETLNVWLNDRHVITDANLPSISPTGAIGLQKHGSAVEWCNLMVRPLP